MYKYWRWTLYVFVFCPIIMINYSTLGSLILIDLIVFLNKSSVKCGIILYFTSTILLGQNKQLV